jgi:hypothetical protein
VYLVKCKLVPEFIVRIRNCHRPGVEVQVYRVLCS